MTQYDAIAKMTGVAREDVKKVFHAAGYSGGLPEDKLVHWVVCANDYPDSIFSTEILAQAFVSEKKEQEERRQKNRGLTGPRVYWRYYEFEVDAKIIRRNPDV